MSSKKRKSQEPKRLGDPIGSNPFLFFYPRTRPPPPLPSGGEDALFF